MNHPALPAPIPLPEVELSDQALNKRTSRKVHILQRSREIIRGRWARQMLIGRLVGGGDLRYGIEDRDEIISAIHDNTICMCAVGAIALATAIDFGDEYDNDHVTRAIARTSLSDALYEALPGHVKERWLAKERRFTEPCWALPESEEPVPAFEKLRAVEWYNDEMATSEADIDALFARAIDILKAEAASEPES